MRTRKTSVFFIMIAVIFLTIVITRHFIGSPLIVAIIVFLVIRKMKNREKEDRDSTERKSYDDDTGRDPYDDGRRAGYYSSTFTGKTADTFITCEYCGSRIDTEKNACCDHCGASYWDNKEWNEMCGRHNM